jgi:hypothetical protein
LSAACWVPAAIRIAETPSRIGPSSARPENWLRTLALRASAALKRK